jgi:hypothetical protein
LAYVLKEGLNVGLDYQFKMTLTCPQSSKLWEDVQRLDRLQALEICGTRDQEGVTVEPGAESLAFKSRTEAATRESIVLLVELLTERSTYPDLMATALFVYLQTDRASERTTARLVKRIRSIRRHVDEGLATSTVEGLELLRASAHAGPSETPTWTKFEEQLALDVN